MQLVPFFLVSYFWHFCDLTLIIKFSKVRTEYSRRILLSDSHTNDPLITFNSLQLKLLCDVVIRAKMFVFYLDRIPRPEEDILRSSSVSSQPNCSSVPGKSTHSYTFKYTLTPVIVNKYVQLVRILQCGHEDEAKLNVTFGLVDKFLYLVEPTINWSKPGIRATAIVEPHALLGADDPHELLQYFHDQVFSALSDRLEHKILSSMSSICNFNSSEKIRICSSAFDTLRKKKYFENDSHVNYVRINRFRCIQKIVILGESEILPPVRVLPCSINSVSWPSFFVLADPLEPGSLFVFFNKENDIIALTARIRKIGALLNPAKLK